MPDNFGEFWRRLTNDPPPPGWHLVKASSGGLTKAQNGTAGAPGGLLAPDDKAVEIALAALPNWPGDERDRDQWIAVCHATFGATGGSEAGKEAWLSWSGQWSDDAGAVANAERAWATLDPASISIGWEWLKSKAAGESADYRQTYAAEDFAHSDDDETEPAPLDDGGVFAKPQTDADEINAMLDALQRGDTAGADQVCKRIGRSSLTLIARDQIIRKLKLITGTPLATLTREIANYARSFRREHPDLQIRLARATEDYFGKGLLAFHDKRWWRFTSTHWQRQQSTVFISEVMLKLIDTDPMLLFSEAGQRHHSSSMIKGALSNLEGYCCNVLTRLNEPYSVVRRAVNCMNGTIWFDEKGKQDFQPHDPRNAFTYVLRVKYDPNPDPLGEAAYSRAIADAQSQTYFTLTEKIDADDYASVSTQLEGKTASKLAPLTLRDGRRAWRVGRHAIKVVDVQENVRFLHECLGYGLITERFTKAFVVLQGPGGNAKSELLRFYCNLMPGQFLRTSNDALESRFIFSQLRGVSVLLIEEGQSASTPSERIKELCENSYMTGDVKGQDFAGVMLTTLPIVLSNHAFESDDASAGMLERINIIPFLRIYDETERLQSPWAKMAMSEAEKSAALGCWLDGLSRMMQRGYLLRSKAVKEAVQEWSLRNTIERMFLFEYTTTKQPKDSKSSGELLLNLYRAFETWCAMHRIRPVKSYQNFTKRLQEVGGLQFYKTKGVTRIEGVWVKPRRIDAPGYVTTDFEPLNDDGTDRPRPDDPDDELEDDD